MIAETRMSHTPHSVLCGMVGTIVPWRYFSYPFLPLENMYNWNYAAFMFYKRLHRGYLLQSMCLESKSTVSTITPLVDICCPKPLRKMSLERCAGSRSHLEMWGVWLFLPRTAFEGGQRHGMIHPPSDQQRGGCWSSPAVHHVLHPPLHRPKPDRTALGSII